MRGIIVLVEIVAAAAVGFCIYMAYTGTVPCKWMAEVNGVPSALAPMACVFTGHAPYEFISVVDWKHK